MASMADQVHPSEETQPLRKRIAVACGRCRKRKIRCSGDPGHGQPCSNCKNAGNTECLFLRVQSTETPFRSENGYGYNLDASRGFSQRVSVPVTSGGPMGSPAMGSAYHDVALLGAGSMAPAGGYRPGSSTSTYHSLGKSGYYPMPGEWSDVYGHDSAGVDYSGVNPMYQSINHDASSVNMLSPYAQWPIARHKGALPHAGYADDSTYGYSPTSLAHRPSVSSESTNFSFSTVAASLPSNSSLLGRSLPNPTATARSNVATSTTTGHDHDLHSSSDSCSSGTAHTSPTSPVAEIATASYGNAYDASGLASYGLSSSSGSGLGSTSDTTTSTSSASGSIAAAAEYIFSEPDRNAVSQGAASQVDMPSYTYGAGASDYSRSGRRHSSIATTATSSTQSRRTTTDSTISSHDGLHHHDPHNYAFTPVDMSSHGSAHAYSQRRHDSSSSTTQSLRHGQERQRLLSSASSAAGGSAGNVGHSASSRHKTANSGVSGSPRGSGGGGGKSGSAVASEARRTSVSTRH